jgi:hypothetical protein
MVRGRGASKGNDSEGEDFRAHVGNSAKLKSGEVEGSHVIDN